MKIELTKDWCMNMAASEAAAGDLDCSAGAPARGLVERLRDSSGGHINGLYDRAADEIERLTELADSEGTRAVNYLRRARKAEKVLRELVALEDMRLRLRQLHEMGHGTDYADYHRLLPLAWAAAREALGPNVRANRANDPIPERLLDIIGRYGNARSGGCDEAEIIYRWEELCGSIKQYVAAERERCASLVERRAGPLRTGAYDALISAAAAIRGA